MDRVLRATRVRRVERRREATGALISELDHWTSFIKAFIVSLTSAFLFFFFACGIIGFPNCRFVIGGIWIIALLAGFFMRGILGLPKKGEIVAWVSEGRLGLPLISFETSIESIACVECVVSTRVVFSPVVFYEAWLVYTDGRRAIVNRASSVAEGSCAVSSELADLIRKPYRKVRTETVG